MTKIHPTALVDPKAQLSSGVEVGPYSLIGPHAVIGKDTKISNHVTISGHTQIGERCRIFSYACLGASPQVRKEPQRSYLKIGDDNLIREFVTMNPGMHEEGMTSVGCKNFIMMNCHIAHDCSVGSEVTFANGASLSGHVKVEDHVTIGGLSGAHQFVRIGKYAMVGGLSKIVMDVPPFSTCDGNPASFFGINTLGLKRAGFLPADRLAIRKSLKILLASGKKISTAVSEIEKEFSINPHVRYILDFIKDSKRGISRFKSSALENKDHDVV